MSFIPVSVDPKLGWLFELPRPGRLIDYSRTCPKWLSIQECVPPGQVGEMETYRRSLERYLTISAPSRQLFEHCRSAKSHMVTAVLGYYGCQSTGSKDKLRRDSESFKRLWVKCESDLRAMQSQRDEKQVACVALAEQVAELVSKRDEARKTAESLAGRLGLEVTW